MREDIRMDYLEQRYRQKKDYRKAQAVIELAVFGAVLIFVIGLIVRQQINYSLVQNQQLRAMRWAMALSHMHSEGLIDIGGGSDGDMSRNNAGVIVVEDRLTADAGKYGAVNRIPLIAMGDATHSRNLYMPMEYGERYNLSVTDMIINGQHFVFTTGDFRQVNLDPSSGGCPVLWKRAYNYPYVQFQSEWCSKDPCPGGASAWNTVSWRFDLDHSGFKSSPPVAEPDVPASPASLRQRFTWQWEPISFHDIDPDDNKNVFVDVDWCCQYAPWSSQPWCSRGGDPEPEYVMKRKGSIGYVYDTQLGDLDFSSDQQPPPGLLRDRDIETYVLDDKNGTYMRVEEGEKHDPSKSGILSLFIRTTQKKHSIDIVQRIIQLSNDTNRFCDRNHKPTCSPGSNPADCASALWTAAVPNPVKACSDCMGANATVTCMDEGDMSAHPPRRPRIFVRSRILDRHGRRWATNLDKDPYINIHR